MTSTDVKNFRDDFQNAVTELKKKSMVLILAQVLSVTQIVN